MDTERGEMSEHHSQSQDEATISSILGAVFSVEKEEETAVTMPSTKLDEEGIAKSSAKSDEEGIAMFSAKQGAKRQRGETSSTKKGGKIKSTAL